MNAVFHKNVFIVVARVKRGDGEEMKRRSVQRACHPERKFRDATCVLAPSGTLVEGNDGEPFTDTRLPGVQIPLTLGNSP